MRGWMEGRWDGGDGGDGEDGLMEWNGWDGGDGLMDRVCGGIMGKDVIYFCFAHSIVGVLEKGKGKGFVRKCHLNTEMKN